MSVLPYIKDSARGRIDAQSTMPWRSWMQNGTLMGAPFAGEEEEEEEELLKLPYGEEIKESIVTFADDMANKCARSRPLKTRTAVTKHTQIKDVMMTCKTWESLVHWEKADWKSLSHTQSENRRLFLFEKTMGPSNVTVEAFLECTKSSVRLTCSASSG